MENNTEAVATGRAEAEEKEEKEKKEKYPEEWEQYH